MNKKQSKKSGKRASPLDSELMQLMRLVEADDSHAVERVARQILNKRPGHPLATKALTFGLIGLGRYAEALPILDLAVAQWSGDPELHNNRGIALSSLMRWQESITAFNQSLALKPNDPSTLKNLGVAHLRRKDWAAAVQALIQAVEHYPGDYVEAIELLALCLVKTENLDQAAVCYETLWESRQDPAYLYSLVMTQYRRCDWTAVGERVSMLRDVVDSIDGSIGDPFVSLSLPGFSAAQQAQIAAAYARLQIPTDLPVNSEPGVLGERRPVRGRRPRVGYLSADFRAHPVGYILPRVIELHDRNRFEVFGYSIGRNDGSDARQRLERAFDRFVDAWDLEAVELAGRIQSDEIDILVDLNGWTSDCRPEVLAMRCAPVQVNWLGYPGTVGDRRLADYLIGDSIVTPLGDSAHYAEIIERMPSCYLPASVPDVRPQAPSRNNVGLPSEAFVFCSFNNVYKLNPRVLDLWCKVMAATPNSVLWLSRPPGGAADRLVSEFSARGVDASRIVFASRTASHLEHLARLQCADVALDPFPYNSHSTGIDMLWAGVPMITLLGATFAGRVGASLMHSVGLSELVCATEDGYLEVAELLYNDRHYYRNVRRRLADAPGNKPLFDMPGFVSALEACFERILRS